MRIRGRQKGTLANTRRVPATRARFQREAGGHLCEPWGPCPLFARLHRQFLHLSRPQLPAHRLQQEQVAQMIPPPGQPHRCQRKPRGPWHQGPPETRQSVMSLVGCSPRGKLWASPENRNFETSTFSWLVRFPLPCFPLRGTGRLLEASGKGTTRQSGECGTQICLTFQLHLENSLTPHSIACAGWTEFHLKGMFLWGGGGGGERERVCAIQAHPWMCAFWEDAL